MPVYDQRQAPNTRATPLQTAEMFKNPNYMPIAARRSRTASASGSSELEGQEESLPQLWNPALDDLFRRTADDYDLVMNYERDAEGGQRWLPEDIKKIRKVGKTLHRDIFAMRRRQRAVAELGDQDTGMMIQIKREVNLLKLLCERVQEAICKFEQKCEFELLRDGLYVRDDDGNFYKPTTSQQYQADDGYHQDPPHRTLKRQQDENKYIQLSYDQEEYHRVASTFQATTNKRSSSPANRNFAVDSSLETTRFDDNARGSTHHDRQSVPRHVDDKVLDSRITKSHRQPPLGNSTFINASRVIANTSPARTHRTSSPAYGDTRRDHEKRPEQRASHPKPHLRSHTNKIERHGKSRRQARRDRESRGSPGPFAGRLGKHTLHW